MRPEPRKGFPGKRDDEALSLSTLALDESSLAGQLLTSLIANCKMCDADPVNCPSGTLRALLDGHPRSRIDGLVPWNFWPASSRAA